MIPRSIADVRLAAADRNRDEVETALLNSCGGFGWAIHPNAL